MIINDPKSPYANQYDEELVMSLTDWYHDKQCEFFERAHDEIVRLTQYSDTKRMLSLTQL